MKLRVYYMLIFILFGVNLFSQVDTSKYLIHIEEYRQKHQRDLVRDLHSPITRYDLNFISFFEPDIKYKVSCKTTDLLDQEFIDFGTSSGALRKYRKHKKLDCEIGDSIFTIYSYESKRLLESEKHKDYIFLPFTDYTNGETSYGGGRYLDLQRKDFANDSVILDFNKSYNPYCSYSSGYSCTIPPRDNLIRMEIPAGEKKYIGEKKHRHK